MQGKVYKRNRATKFILMPNHIKIFLTSLLKQRKKCIDAEVGNYTLMVISAFNAIQKDFTTVSTGKYRNEEKPYKNLFKMHEGNIRIIMFGESAKQHKKLKEMFDNAFLIANCV